MHIKFRLLQDSELIETPTTDGYEFGVRLRYRIQYKNFYGGWKNFNYQWDGFITFYSEQNAIEYVRNINPLYLSFWFRVFGGMYDCYPKLLQYPTVIIHDFKH